ncbi:MAG TPA: indolepyruvate oxidoreductase subunit beta family protein [Methylomirabilota bacterium]|nr:indolepyruvate oxidoreductase subunit beta family protein [Methylomirabilota bacterium]
MTDGVLSILIPAVGGQGGGVLSEWIVEAASLDGYRVHGTSIPGVAQRTGSTTYYVEVAVDRAGDDEPAFSLYPVPGALDVLVAPEFLEVGRMAEGGFVSPARTTVVCSTHRLYSIHEKIATGRAIYPREDLEALARAAARRLVAFDALAVAREHRTEVNAVLLGALAGSGALPITPRAFRNAIEARGVAVATNVAGFDIGVAIANGAAADGTPGRETTAPVPLPAAWTAAVAELPEATRDVVTLAIPRLLDYQDEPYARRYLERLRPFVRHARVAPIVARHLAVWMTYEDAIRVAQAKTRASRFARIRSEARAAGDAEIEVIDYLKPDLDEIWGVLPRGLVAPFARWAERRWPHGRPTLGQHVRTTTISGFLRVWLLTWLRPLRPISWRAHEEHARIDRWLAGVHAAVARDEALACEVAQLAQLVKGYGDVRRRLLGVLDLALDTVVHAAERDTDMASSLAARLRTLVLEGPDGETRAEALCAAVRDRLAADDVGGARSLLVV